MERHFPDAGVTYCTVSWTCRCGPLLHMAYTSPFLYSRIRFSYAKFLLRDKLILRTCDLKNSLINEQEYLKWAGVLDQLGTASEKHLATCGYLWVVNLNSLGAIQADPRKHQEPYKFITSYLGGTTCISRILVAFSTFCHFSSLILFKKEAQVTQSSK